MFPQVFTLCALVRIPHYQEGNQPPEEHQCTISIEHLLGEVTVFPQLLICEKHFKNTC